MCGLHNHTDEHHCQPAAILSLLDRLFDVGDPKKPQWHSEMAKRMHIVWQSSSTVMYHVCEQPGVQCAEIPNAGMTYSTAGSQTVAYMSGSHVICSKQQGPCSVTAEDSLQAKFEHGKGRVGSGGLGGGVGLGGRGGWDYLVVGMCVRISSTPNRSKADLKL